MKTLTEQLQDWSDIDVAMHLLAVNLGMIEDHPDAFFQHKWMYWSENPYGDTLYAMLMGLVKIGVLQYDHEGMSVKVNAGFSIEQ